MEELSFPSTGLIRFSILKNYRHLGDNKLNSFLVSLEKKCHFYCVSKNVEI